MPNLNLFRLSAFALLTLTATGLQPAPASAAEYTMKFGTTTLGDTQHRFGERLKEVLEKATKGRLEVQVYPRSQLGSNQAHVDGLQLGTIEASMSPIDFFAGVDPRGGVFSSPFLFKNRAHANRVLRDKELFNDIMNIFESKGIVGIMTVGSADGKYIARNPLRKLTDFQGKKMRVNATDAERERMRRLGSTAIPMTLGEMVTSLQSGVIDGTMSGISVHVNFNLDSVSKTLLKTEDTLLIAFCGISKKWLDTLPADLRETIIREGRAMQDVALELANDEDATLSKKWLERGGEFIEFSPQDHAEMRKLTETVGADVSAKNPAVKEFYEKVKATAAKY